MKSKKRAETPVIEPELPRVADSIGAAAAMMGYDIDVLKAAKRAGCPAFKGSRVEIPELEEWLAVHPDFVAVRERAGTLAQAEVMEAWAKAMTRRDNYQRTRRLLIPADEVRRSFTRAVMTFKSRMFGIPAAMAQILAMSSDPIDIETRLKDEIGDAFDELNKSQFMGCKCQKCGEEIR